MALARRAGAGKKTVGRHALVAELSPGVVGPLWLASARGSERTGQPVFARRVLKDKLVDDAAIDSLAQAAIWAADVRHDAVVRVLGTERDDAELVVVSAYHEAEPLRALMRLMAIARKPAPPRVALRIAHDLLGGIASSHAARAGDDRVWAAVNPDNVLVGSDGRARLLEPGIWMVATRTDPWRNDPKRAAYDAPELIANDQLGPESDVFSVGVLLWEMMKNRPLFAAPSVDEVRKRVLAGAVRRVDALKPAGGEAIENTVANVVAQALERDVDERFVSPAEMRAAVEAEDLASHAEVAAFVSELAAAALAKQRRHVQEIGSVPPPAPVAAQASGPPRAPVRAPAAPRPLVDPAPEPRGTPAPEPRGTPAPEDAAEPPGMLAPHDPSVPPPPLGKPDAVPPARATPGPSTRKGPLPGSMKQTLLGMAKLPPPEAPVATTVPSEPPPAVTAHGIIEVDAPRDEAEDFVIESTNVEGTPPDLADALRPNLAAQKGDFGVGVALEAARAQEAPLPVAAPASEDSFGLLSIADDPSVDDDMPPEAARALERAAKGDERRGVPMHLIAAGSIAVLFGVVIFVFFFGDDRSDRDAPVVSATATATGSAAAPTRSAVPTATVLTSASAAAATAAASAPSVALSASAAPEPPPAGNLPRPGLPAPGKGAVKSTPRPQPPRPQPPRPQPPRPQPKYRPGGI